MLDPSQLVRLETDTPVADLHAGVLCLALGGFVDAGHTERLLAEHLLREHDSTVVASFDLDQLLDYRGRRPLMTFSGDRFTAYDEPSLVLHRLLDRDGTPFLLLVGPEPDYQWNRLAAAILQLSAGLGVKLTVSIHGIPMAVPHTRPLGVTTHGTTPELMTPNVPDFGELQVPASFSSMLEYRLGEAGRDVVGFSVHVPHYLGATDFADAALLGLDRLVAVTGLDLARDSLADLAVTHRAAIAEHVASSEEIGAVIVALEQQFDSFVHGQTQPSLLAQDIPSADELGAQFEAFLRNVDDE